jgi:hypothetical protein
VVSLLLDHAANFLAVWSNRRTIMISSRFRLIRVLLLVYLAATVATHAVLAVRRDDTAFATDEAWGHAIVVLVFAALLVPAASRAARGSRGAYRRLLIVSIVIPVASVVLVALPHLLPEWMRIEQAAYGALLLVVAVLAASGPVRRSVGPLRHSSPRGT